MRRSSRPRESMRPTIVAETRPASPEHANANPTPSSEPPSWRSTMSGTTMMTMPPAKVLADMAIARPRSVRFCHT